MKVTSTSFADEKRIPGGVSRSVRPIPSRT